MFLKLYNVLLIFCKAPKSYTIFRLGSYKSVDNNNNNSNNNNNNNNNNNKNNNNNN